MSNNNSHARIDILDLPALETLVVKWYHYRNLINGSTDKDQVLKLTQEVGELSDSICHQESPIDDLGDIMVVIMNILERHGLSITDCLRHSYKDIMHRTGRMVDGVFIKSDDEAHQQEAREETDEWIAYPEDATECPLPANTLHQVRLRTGSVTRPCYRPEIWNWGRRGPLNVPIAYRRLLPDSYIDWDGNDNQPPVQLTKGQTVECMTRAGGFFRTRAPMYIDWEHKMKSNDVVMYRVVNDG